MKKFIFKQFFGKRMLLPLTKVKADLHTNRCAGVFSYNELNFACGL